MTGFRRGRDRNDRSSGQSLVEFALVFPMFFILFLGFIEFAFAFNAILGVNFASRNAALAAAEAGAAQGADCVILTGIEEDVAAPANRTNIIKVDIYRAKSNGDDYLPAQRTTYTRTSSGPCTLPDGTVITIPYTRTANAYPELERCNILAGCPGPNNHTTIDHIGVRVYYDHPYVTPLTTFVGTGDGIIFDRSNVMRMEPIL